MERTELGTRGESAAAAYLERTGMQVIERNWRVPRGEIDIIALDGDVLVLCEVKTRSTVGKGTPEEAISSTKRKRIGRLAEEYIASAGIAPCAVRFDVVSITVLGPERALLRHHRAAFELE